MERKVREDDGDDGGGQRMLFYDGGVKKIGNNYMYY